MNDAMRDELDYTAERCRQDAIAFWERRHRGEEDDGTLAALKALEGEQLSNAFHMACVLSLNEKVSFHQKALVRPEEFVMNASVLMAMQRAVEDEERHMRGMGACAIQSRKAFELGLDVDKVVRRLCDIFWERAGERVKERVQADPEGFWGTLLRDLGVEGEKE